MRGTPTKWLLMSSKVTANALSGTDTATLRVTDTGRGIAMVTGEAVRIGTAGKDEPPLQIVSSKNGRVIAVGLSETGDVVDVLVTNDKTGNVLWLHAGGLFGLLGQAILMHCR